MDKIIRIVHPFGTVRYYKNNTLYMEIYIDGNLIRYYDHNNGPNVIGSNGMRVWKDKTGKDSMVYIHAMPDSDRIITDSNINLKDII